MSMSYAPIWRYAFILTEEAWDRLNLSTDLDFEEFVEELTDTLDGSVRIDTEVSYHNFSSLGSDSDLVDELHGAFVLPLDHQPELTRAVYASVDDMVAEVRQKMKPYLPEDFDYAYYIGLHSGAEWV